MYCIVICNSRTKVRCLIVKYLQLFYFYFLCDIGQKIKNRTRNTVVNDVQLALSNKEARRLMIRETEVLLETDEDYNRDVNKQ